MTTYKFKLYSNHGNIKLHKTIDGHADVWNHCVALERRYYAIYGRYISKVRLINHISKLKGTQRFDHWNQLPSQAVQDVEPDLIRATTRCLKRVLWERNGAALV